MSQCGTNCQHFGEHVLTSENCGPQVFCCLSPERSGLTELEVCAACPYYSPLQYPHWDWAVAVTTVPERKYLLEKTCLSLERSGQKPPFSICQDGDHDLGPFGNFYNAATVLYLDNPHANAYLICQDDVAFHKDTKAIVESNFRICDEPKDLKLLPPVLSLYTAPEIQDHKPPPQESTEENFQPYWYRMNEGHSSPGACCYVFSDIGLRDLLTDPVFLAHRRIGATNGWRDLDGAIGVWATKHGGIWHRCPSLVKHVGTKSTIDRKGGK